MKASVFKWTWPFAGEVGAFLQKHAKSTERCLVPKKDGGLVSTLYVHLVDISISWTTSSARPCFSSMHSCPSRPIRVSSPDVRHNVRPRGGSSPCCLSGLHCRIQITLPKLQMSCISILSVWVSLEEHMLGLQGMAFPSCLHIFNQSRDHLQRYCMGKLFYCCRRFNPDSPHWTREALLCFSTFPLGGPMEVCIFLCWRADCFWEGRHAFFVTA